MKIIAKFQELGFELLPLLKFSDNDEVITDNEVYFEV